MRLGGGFDRFEGKQILSYRVTVWLACDLGVRQDQRLCGPNGTLSSQAETWIGQRTLSSHGHASSQHPAGESWSRSSLRTWSSSLIESPWLSQNEGDFKCSGIDGGTQKSVLTRHWGLDGAGLNISQIIDGLVIPGWAGIRNATQAKRWVR